MAATRCCIGRADLFQPSWGRWGADLRRLMGDSTCDWRLKHVLRYWPGAPPASRIADCGCLSLAGQRAIGRARWIRRRTSADRYWQANFCPVAVHATLYVRDGGRPSGRSGVPAARTAGAGARQQHLSARGGQLLLFAESVGHSGGRGGRDTGATQRSPTVRRAADLVERAAKSAETGSVGLPVGVQVAARHWREDVALAVMGRLEAFFRDSGRLSEPPGY